MHRRVWWIWLLSTALLRSQAPLVDARGVVNGVSFELAPSTAALGGIFNIYGQNLAAGASLASSVPLPTSLGSPPVEVTVNGRPAALYFVSPTQINAQVPWETEPGPAQVVVRRGGMSSQPALLLVQPVEPSLFALNGAGFGPAIAVSAASGSFVDRANPPRPGDVVVLYGSGLGPVQPPVATGAPGPSGPLARVARPQQAFMNGFLANVLFAGLAPGFVGLFQINLQLPGQTAPGDVLQYFSGNQMANRLTLGSPETPRMRVLRLPEGLGNPAGIVDTDLNGGFVAVNGPRGDNGCYQNVHILDFRRNQATRITECLIHANPSAPTPFVAENNAARLAALVGPPVGTAPAGISARVLIVDGASGRTTTIELPAPAVSVLPGGAAARGLVATLPGDPPRQAVINPATGDVQVLAGGQGPAPGGPGVGDLRPGGIGPIPAVNVDGLTHVVSTATRLPGNRIALVAADHETSPQRAIFVVLSASGEVLAQVPFPAGYLPLIPPLARQGAVPEGPGRAPQPGPAPQPGAGTPPAPRAAAVANLQAGRVILLARSRDGANDGLAIFQVEGASGRAVDFPPGIFAASCAPNIRILSLALARKLVVPISDRLETAAANPCISTGLLLFDEAGSSMRQVALPESGTLNTNAVNVLNDYVYGPNADRLSQTSSTVFVLDGINDTISKLDTPRGATGFTNLQPIPVTGHLLGLATNRTPGDEGLVLFALSGGAVRLFPVPEGFVRVANPGMQLATRKLTARGFKPGTEGSQLLVYDPGTGAVTAVANPPQAQAIGSPAAGGAQVRVVWDRNQNSNTILTTVFGGGNQPIGLALIEGI